MRSTRTLLAVTAAALLALGISAPGAAQDAAASAAPPAPAAAPPAVPSPKPGPDDPKRHKFAVRQFLAWQQGTVDRTLYGEDVNEALSDEVLDRGTRTLANMGALQSATFLGTSHAKGQDIYVYKMTCEHGSVNMDFALSPDGKISLIFFE